MGLDQLITSVGAWPHKRTTWEYVESIGQHEATAYWQSTPAWCMDAEGSELVSAIQNYLQVDRAEYVVDALAMKAKELPSDLLLRIIDQFATRIAANPEILRSQSLGFDIKQLFAELQRRTDLPLTEVAGREYQFLPILREEFTEDGKVSLTLDRYMAEDPRFFVRILCDVYRPAQTEEDDVPISDEAKARANLGWRLLEGFKEIPGTSGDVVDVERLRAWVAEVRRLAAEAGRLKVAEHRIGNVLGRSGPDPADNLWPRREIRDCIEDWQSKEIEHGIFLGKLNTRGGTQRGAYEGGDQERVIAASYRDDASKLAPWPRTRALVQSLAAYFDSEGRREDVRARQAQLRDR